MNDIQKGDLVMVVKPRLCCGDRSSMGVIFTVRDFARIGTWCGICGHEEIIQFAFSTSGIGDDIRCLQKINPPKAIEVVHEKSEVPA